MDFNIRNQPPRASSAETASVRRRDARHCFLEEWRTGKRARHEETAFTLIELLVVIAIISILAALLSPTLKGARAGEPKNVIQNPGFEESTEVDLQKSYPQLLENGVQMPKGDPAFMPLHLYVNPADGWGLAGTNATFEYVEGKAGEAVHSGKYAIHIVSPKHRVGTAVGSKVDVVEGVGLDDSALRVGKAHRFSFFAKGNGSILVNCYMYESNHANIYDYQRCRSIEPESLSVDDDQQWQKLEGALKIKCPEVASILFVLCVQGDVAIDDVVLDAN